MYTSAKDLTKIFNVDRTVLIKQVLTTETDICKGQEIQKDVLKIYVRPDARWEHRCPCCMEKRGVYDHQSKEASWRAPSINGTIVRLIYTPARIRCPNCGIVREYIPWADGTTRSTPDVNQ